MATIVDGPVGDIPSSPDLPSSVDQAPFEEQASQLHLRRPSQPAVDPEVDQTQLREQLEKVTLSDIGLDTLLKRTKQSIASARDFATFLKKRSIIEEEHATGLKKLTRAVHDGIRRPEHRQGSYAQAYDEVTRIQERMAEHGLQFALSLHQMSDDLVELAANVERGRKHWKQVGTTAEKRVLDAENALEKAKTKYNSLAEQYDRARTGDRQSGRFGLKGPKSAAQQEEDLHRKVQAADEDYQGKVHAARSQRQELISTLRPHATKALQDLISEADSGLVLQMQKYATFNEKLLLGNGLVVSPLKNQTNGAGPQSKSLRDVIQGVNNDNDFHRYILSHTGQARPRIGEIKYEQHPTLRSAKQDPSPAAAQNFNNFQSQPSLAPQTPQPPEQPPFASEPRPSSGYQSGSPRPPQIGQLPGLPSPQAPPAMRDGLPGSQQGSPYASPRDPRDQFAHQSPDFGQQAHNSPKLAPISNFEPLSMSGGVSNGPSGPLQNHAPPTAAPQNHMPPASTSQGRMPPAAATAAPPNGHASRPSASQANLPPLNPVFGVSLEELFQRDQSAVPMIVYQCSQAVDLFGLDLEGIYRTSGSNPHIMELKQLFDHDASVVDFRDPTTFHHDISSVAGLLKLFFRSLPDPLLTNQHYSEFISAAQIPDDVLRRDSLHAIVNALPDPNYATLRVITLHLNRIQQRSHVNRMTAQNLAIVWGPTLMQGEAGRGDIRDAGWQAKVIETILVNTFQIFDDDE